jgi:hypothetical protein
MIPGIKNYGLSSMASSGMLRRVALVRTDVSEELSTSFIWVIRIGELWKTLAVNSNRHTLQRNTNTTWYFFAACISCWLQLMLFLVHRFLSPWWRRRYVPPKRRFLQEPHGVTSQKTTFFTVTAVKTSNLTYGLSNFPTCYFPCRRGGGSRTLIHVINFCKYPSKAYLSHVKCSICGVCDSIISNNTFQIIFNL